MRKKKNLLALIGTLILLLSLSVPLMQCAPAGEEEVAPPTEETEYGGRLNIGFTRPIDILTPDVKLMWSEWGCLYTILVYDNLAHYGVQPDTYTFWPKLVKSYEVSEDGTTWTMHLVENATWHDGVPFTAEDVAFTFEYLFGKTPGWGGPLTTFEDIDVIDDYTIKVVHGIELSTAHIPGWWLWNPIIPKHIFEPYKDDILSFENEEAIGTGALKLKENKFEQYQWMVANEDYFGERPYVDEVIFRAYGNLESLLMALESGEVDVFGDVSVPPLALEDIQANPDIKVETMPGVRLNYLNFNLHTDGPLQNKLVRQAILYGIDCDRLVDMAYGGYAERYDGFIYTESPMHNPDLPQYDYNPDKANEILDGAGYMDTDGDGIRNNPTTGENLVFDLIAAAGESAHVKMCIMIEEMLPEIGIHVDFNSLDFNAFALTHGQIGCGRYLLVGVLGGSTRTRLTTITLDLTNCSLIIPARKTWRAKKRFYTRCRRFWLKIYQELG